MTNPEDMFYVITVFLSINRDFKKLGRDAEDNVN